MEIDDPIIVISSIDNDSKKDSFDYETALQIVNTSEQETEFIDLDLNDRELFSFYPIY